MPIEFEFKEANRSVLHMTGIVFKKSTTVVIIRNPSVNGYTFLVTYPHSDVSPVINVSRPILTYKEVIDAVRSAIPQDEVSFPEITNRLKISGVIQ